MRYFYSIIALLIVFYAASQGPDMTCVKTEIENPRKKKFDLIKTSLGRQAIITELNNASFPDVKATVKPLSSQLLGKAFLRSLVSGTKAKRILLKPVISDYKGFKADPGSRFLVKHLDVSNGIPSNEIACTYLDSTGTAFIAYQGGIVKISKGKMYTYGSLSGFPDAIIKDIIQYNGAIYIATFGEGLYILKNDSLTTFNQESGFPSNHITTFSVLNGNLFVGTLNRFLFVIKKDETISEVILPAIGSKTNVYSLSSADKDLLICSAQGVYRLSGSDWQVFNMRILDNSVSVSHATADRRRNFYLTTNEGDVYKIEKDSVRIFHLPQMSDLNKIYIGKSGTAWIGSGTNGLGMLAPDMTLKLFSGIDGIKSHDIRDIDQDIYNNLWVSTASHGLLLISPNNFTNLENGNTDLYDICTNENGEVVYENAQDGGLVFLGKKEKRILKNKLLTKLRSICFNAVNGSYWMSGTESLFELTKDNVLYSYAIMESKTRTIGSILGVSCGKTDRVVVSSYNYGPVIIENGESYFYPSWKEQGNSLVYHSLVTDENEVLVCSHGGNLGIIKKNKITSFHFADSSGPVRIYTAIPTSGNTYYVGTNKGLFKIDKDKALPVFFEELSQMGRILSLYYDRNKKIVWASTSRGLAALGNKDADIFGPGSGMASCAFKMNAVTSNSKNKIYWVSSEGIVEYSDFAFSAKSINRTLNFGTVSVFNDHHETVSMNDRFIKFDSISDGLPYGLVLPHNYNSIEIPLYSVNWGKEDLSEMQFSIGRNDKWKLVPEDGVVRLDYLDPGNYTMRVKLVYPEAPEIYKEFNFSVAKPFYREFWFLLLTLTVLIVLVFIGLSAIRSYNFDRMENYNAGKFLVTKIRVLIIANVVLLMVIDYIQGEVFHNYKVYWLLNITISLISLVVYLYTYRLKSRFNVLNYLAWIFYFLLCGIYFVRAYSEDFSPIISIEASIAILFAIFIFREIKNVILFGVVTVGFAIVLTSFSDATSPDKSLFVSATVQAFIAIFVFTLIESRKLIKVLFSDMILKESSQFVIVFEENGHVVFANDHLIKKTSIKEKDVLGNGWWTLPFWTASETEKEKERIHQCILENKNEKYKEELVLAGKKTILKWTRTPIGGRYLLAIGEDITIETEQKEELERLSLVATNVINGVVILDKDHRIEWINDSFSRMMEYSLDEIKGLRPIHTFSGKGTSESVIRKITDDENVAVIDIVQYTQSGKAIDLLIHQNPLYDKNGEITKRVMIVTDITERKKEEERYKFIIENAGEVIYTTNELGEFTFISKSVMAVSGYEPEELMGKPYLCLVHEKELAGVSAFYLKQFRKNIPVTNRNFLIRTKCGEEKWVSQTVRLLKKEDRHIGFQGVVKDIHGERLKELENRKLSFVAEKAINGVTICGEQGEVLWANKSYLKMFEIGFEDLVGKRPRDLFNGGEEDLHQHVEEMNQSNKNFKLEIATKTFAGRPIWIELNSSSFLDADGIPMKVEVINDITERKIAEKIIHDKTEDIMSSIRYAQRIQNALLTPRSFFEALPIEHFLFYRAKNIIGGDFYCADVVGSKLIVCIGDCTGHGVPGAIMTSIGINGFINAVSEQRKTDPIDIIEYIDEYVLSILSVNDPEQKVDDGMDAGIISYDLESGEVLYAGAGRPLLKINSKGAEKVNFSKRSIGSRFVKSPFTAESFFLQDDTTLYLFSDGITDQFNPVTNRRIGSRALNEKLIALNEFPMKDKENFFGSFMTEYRGTGEQTDDMVLFALKKKQT